MKKITAPLASPYIGEVFSELDDEENSKISTQINAGTECKASQYVLVTESGLMVTSNTQFGFSLTKNQALSYVWNSLPEADSQRLTCQRMLGVPLKAKPQVLAQQNLFAQVLQNSWAEPQNVTPEVKPEVTLEVEDAQEYPRER
jgi:hypothetical protein